MHLHTHGRSQALYPHPAHFPCHRATPRFSQCSILTYHASPNRKSLPVTRHDRQKASAPDLASILGPVNTTGFLFGSDSNGQPVPNGSSSNIISNASKSNQTSPQDGKTYLQVQHTADGFPKLIRREDTAEQAESKDPASPARNRMSMPLPGSRISETNFAGIGDVLNHGTKVTEKPSGRPVVRTTPPRSVVNGNMQPSFSSNDVPTLKSFEVGGMTSPPSKRSSIMEHSKTPSLNRIYNGQYSAALQEHAGPDTNGISGISSPASSLHASAMPFGPSGTNTPNDNSSGITTPVSSLYGQSGYYQGYPNIHLLSNQFSGMNFTSPALAWPAPYHANTYNGYPAYPSNGQAVAGATRFDNGGPRVNARPARNDDATLATINAMKMSDLKGQVFDLCVDQHGCRFLQRKLDDRDPVTTNIIFEEVRPKIYQLMIDPFGNYLCQKLLEFCSDEQRTELIQGTTSRMAEIALNQHGTRALQKMIEFIVTPEQTELIIEALRYKVVMLIQDLNGNHVIQKCLNHLKSADAQFIFDAVGANCVTVGTHRHGCCVLQRCIDHATGLQKGALISQITVHAMTLIQDPFGNYVIQYILDISEPSFTEPLCKAFLGNIGLLSTQKFSSNVIEKCIRCASKETKDLIVHEISTPAQLEGMLRDSYANYVVQTAIDFASDEVKPGFVNNIRPLLAAVRHTPYGRRIQSKINDYDAQIPGAVSATERLNAGLTPTSPNGLLAQYGAYGPTNGARNNRMGFVGAPPAWSLNNASNNATMPLPINGYMMDTTSYNGQNYNNNPRANAQYRFF